MKKKLLFASRDLRVGGMEKALVSLLSSLDFSRFDVTLVLERAEGALLPSLDPRVTVTEYGVSSCGFVPLRRALNLAHRLAFRAKYGKRFDFSCAYATYSIPCGVVSRAASDKCALYIHSDYVTSLGTAGAKEFFDSVSLASYPFVLFVEEGARQRAAALYPEISGRFVTVGNLPDVSEVTALSEEPADVPEKTGDTLVFVGRLDDTSKKLCRLIDAVKILGDTAPAVWVVGDGPDREAYEKYAADAGVGDRFVFLGEKQNPYPFMRAADALVLCSDYEGFPVVYGEAAALSLPVITTVPVSDGTFTVDGSCAYIAEKTAEGVAAAVRECMSDSPRRTLTLDAEAVKEKALARLYAIIG